MSDKIQVIHVKGDPLDEPMNTGKLTTAFSVHADDTIMDIKRKIALSDPNDIGVDEIYLFGRIKKKEETVERRERRRKNEARRKKTYEAHAFWI